MLGPVNSWGFDYGWLLSKYFTNLIVISPRPWTSVISSLLFHVWYPARQSCKRRVPPSLHQKSFHIPPWFGALSVSWTSSPVGSSKWIIRRRWPSALQSVSTPISAGACRWVILAVSVTCTLGILLTGFGSFYSTSDFLKASYPAHQNKVWNGDFNPPWAGRAVPSTLPCWAACSLPSVPFAVFMSSLGSGDWENTLGSRNWWLSGRTHLHLKHHRWPMRRFIIRSNSSVLQTKWGGHPPALSAPSYLPIRSFSLGTVLHHTSPPGTQDLHTLLQLLQSHAFFFFFFFLPPRLYWRRKCHPSISKSLYIDISMYLGLRQLLA